MRETLFENNLVRPYPAGVKTGYVDGDLEPPDWAPAVAQRGRVVELPAEGRRRPLRPDGRRRVHALLPQRRRRPRAGRDPAARGPGDRPGERPRAEPTAADQHRESAVPSRSSTSGRPPGSSSRTPTGSATGRTTRAATARIPLAEDDPLRAYGIDHLTIHPSDPDPTRRPEDDGLPPTFLNEVTHWWDGSQLYGSDWETQRRVRSMARRQAEHRRRRHPPGRPRDGHRADRLLAQLVGRARPPAHGLRARAQRDLRPARGAPPGVGRRDPVPDRPAGQRRGDGQDPHHRVDAGHLAEPLAQRRDDEQLVRPGHQRLRRQAQARPGGHPDHQPRSSAGSSATRRARSRSTG